MRRRKERRRSELAQQSWNVGRPNPAPRVGLVEQKPRPLGAIINRRPLGYLSSLEPAKLARAALKPPVNMLAKTLAPEAVAAKRIERKERLTLIERRKEAPTCKSRPEPPKLKGGGSTGRKWVPWCDRG